MVCTHACLYVYIIVDVHITIYFANTTNLSDKARSHIANTERDIWMIAETHTTLEQIPKELSKIKCLAKQRRHYIAPATPSDTSVKGNYGGVIISASHHLRVGTRHRLFKCSQEQVRLATREWS